MRRSRLLRGRQDIGCLLGQVMIELSSIWKDVYAFKALTEDDKTRVEPIGRGLGQEIFQSLPVFLSRPLHIDFDSATGAQ